MKIDLTEKEISELRDLIYWEQERIQDDKASIGHKEAKNQLKFWDKLSDKLGK